MAEVLLVDDDGSVLLTLAIALRRRGHIVTVAGDAGQALAHLQRHPFAFVISDVRMPGMSGVELAATVRQMPNPPRVILTSAYPSVENHEGAAEAFLQKPLDVEALALILDVGSDNHSRNQPNGGNQSREDNRFNSPLRPMRRPGDWQPASG